MVRFLCCFVVLLFCFGCSKRSQSVEVAGYKDISSEVDIYLVTRKAELIPLAEVKEKFQFPQIKVIGPYYDDQDLQEVLGDEWQKVQPFGMKYSDGSFLLVFLDESGLILAIAEMKTVDYMLDGNNIRKH